MRTFIALALPFVLIACAAQQNTSGSGGDASPVAASPQVPTLGGAGKADSLVISLQRTPCFGTCKAYVINVYRSGYATFEGRSHVELEGMHHTRIGQDTIARILEDAERTGFYQFNDKYDRDVTDLPSSIMRLVANGKDKRVAARIGAPESFKLLFERAEGLLYPVVWRPMPKVE